MTKATETELTKRIEDRDNALKAIGRILADASVTPRRRIERAIGVLNMYGALPALAAPTVQS